MNKPTVSMKVAVNDFMTGHSDCGTGFSFGKQTIYAVGCIAQHCDTHTLNACSAASISSTGMLIKSYIPIELDVCKHHFC